MEQERVILKKLREQNKLTLNQATELIGRSKGWLSEVENNKGRSILRPKEFKRIYDLYNGDKYKRYFGAWVKIAHTPKVKQNSIFDGAIYKFLRNKKANLTTEYAAKKIGISSSYLSKIENGLKHPHKALKEKILKVYGYSSNSWKNFTTQDKRGKSVPIIYKLNILLGRLDESALAEILDFAISVYDHKLNKH